jgi:hypothetical protein
MSGKEFIILFKAESAYLTPDTPLDFTQVELPPVARSFSPAAHWVIRVLSYHAGENKIHVRVLSYRQGEAPFPPWQEEYFDELGLIEKVTFQSIDTIGLLRTLRSQEPRPGDPSGFIAEEPYYPEDGEGSQKEENAKDVQPVIDVISETFFVSLKDIRFKLGGVSFTKKLKDYPYSLDFEISNYDIREEFDAVKNYFANVLKTKKIQVTVRLEITNGEITHQSARSPEIEKINQKLIDSVKFEFVKSTVKKKIRAEVDKSLFTMDEYFGNYADEKFKPNTFFANENDLFENLLQITHTKHYKHLRYLSSKHAHHIMKLRFVHKPFSFVFLLEGERYYHIVWETLDTTEATYLWHTDKNINTLRNTLRKVEDIINTIKVQGKTAYINTHDDPFRRIFHDYSDLVDGFVKWKGELESVLA